VIPSGWVISRRGERWEIVFENSKSAAAITLTDAQASRFLREFSDQREVRLCPGSSVLLSQRGLSAGNTRKPEESVNEERQDTDRASRIRSVLCSFLQFPHYFRENRQRFCTLAADRGHCIRSVRDNRYPWNIPVGKKEIPAKEKKQK
jgi:hypothetical protein